MKSNVMLQLIVKDLRLQRRMITLLTLAGTAAGLGVDALLDFSRHAPAAHTAHPRTEHFAPLFVTLGAGQSDLLMQRPVIEGFWGGLAKRSIQLG